MAFSAEALLCGLVLVPMYTRIDRREALDHGTRGRVHAHLRDHPGSSRRDLCDALGLHPMTLLHHLEVLTTLGIVAARREGREVLYALQDVPSRVPAELRVQPRRMLARALLEAPRTQAELSERTGLSQRLVAYHLGRLGALVAGDHGRPRRYRLTEVELVRASLGDE